LRAIRGDFSFSFLIKDVSMKKLLSLAAVAALSLGAAISAQAASLTGAVGGTGQGGVTARLGLGFDWDKSWWESSTGRLTGYWDAGYTYWGAGEHAGGRHSLSFAPVFVYEFAGDSVKPFIEGGIGIAAFSGSEVGDRDLGGSLNFEDRIGAGVKFGNGQAVGVRAMHYSNAGIHQPNDGIESYSLYYTMPL
jgi:lipid A 3-O-deacylase